MDVRLLLSRREASWSSSWVLACRWRSPRWLQWLRSQLRRCLPAGKPHGEASRASWERSSLAVARGWSAEEICGGIIVSPPPPTAPAAAALRARHWSSKVRIKVGKERELTQRVPQLERPHLSPLPTTSPTLPLELQLTDLSPQLSRKPSPRKAILPERKGSYS